MYRGPSLKAADIENERSVIKEEIAMVFDQPAQYLDDLLSAAAWGVDKPLGRSITGTTESIGALGQAELKHFFERSYVGSQCIIAAAGDITHAQTLDVLAPCLANLAPGEVQILEKPKLQSSKDAFCVAIRDTEQIHFSIAFHAFDRHDDRRYAQKLLSVLLGENMSSLLFQRLREQEAVCYSIQTDVMTYADAGLFHIYCALDPEHLSRALEVIADTLDELCRELPEADSLEECKAYAIGQSRIALESTSAQMTWVGEAVMVYGRLLDPVNSQKRLQAVSGEEVRQVAAELFSPERLVIAAVGPEGVESILANWRDEYGKGNK